MSGALILAISLDSPCYLLGDGNAASVPAWGRAAGGSGESRVRHVGREPTVNVGRQVILSLRRRPDWGDDKMVYPGCSRYRVVFLAETGRGIFLASDSRPRPDRPEQLTASSSAASRPALWVDA